MYREKTDIIEAQKRVAGMDKKKIASASLDGAPGLSHPTPRNGDSHHTWWLPEQHDPEAIASLFGLAA